MQSRYARDQNAFAPTCRRVTTQNPMSIHWLEIKALADVACGRQHCARRSLQLPDSIELQFMARALRRIFIWRGAIARTRTAR
jgi:hypothetical protein